MNFFREAALSLRRNPSAVAILVAAGAALSGADMAMQLFVFRPWIDAPVRALGLGIVAWQILQVTLSAAAQTLAYSRLGREMDKPMWRVKDDREALQRFYKLWVLLGLLTLVYVHGVGALLPANAELGAALAFLGSLFIFATLSNVFGASMMFYGNVARAEAREAFAALGRHAALVVGISLFGILAGVMLRDLNLSALTLAAGPAATPWYLVAPAILLGMLAGAIDAIVGSLIFAYSWLICIFDRDHYEQAGDDFDF